MINSEEFIGKRFGKLIVVEKTEKFDSTGKRKYWRCLCDCGKEAFIIRYSLLSGYTRSCGCLRKNQEKRHEDISPSFWYRIKSNAQTRKISFNLNMKEMWELFLKQNRKCALSGELISLINKTASIDRINSNLSYSIENVWWIHKDLNIIKWDLSLDELYYWCEKIVEYKYQKESERYGTELLYC